MGTHPFVRLALIGDSLGCTEGDPLGLLAPFESMLSCGPSYLFQELFTDATNDTGFSNTRATTQYVETDTGALYPVPAGAIPIQKARPVRNLAASSDTPSTQNITVVVGHVYAVRIGAESASGATAVCSGAFTGTLTGDATDPYALNGVAVTTTLTVTITGSIRKLQVQDITHRAFNNLGSDVVTNGTFDTDSDWTKQSGWSIGSGVATATAVTAYNAIYQSGVIEDGKIYLVSFDVSGYTGGTLQVGIGINGGLATHQVTANGSYVFLGKSFGINSLIVFRSNDAGTPLTCSIDNVTVRPLSAADLVPDEYVSTGVGTGDEEVTNGTFDSGIDGWTAVASAVLSHDSSQYIRIENGAAAYGYAYVAISTIAGQTYVVDGEQISSGAGALTDVDYHIGTGPGSSSILGNQNFGQPKTFIATGATTYLSLLVGGNTSGAYKVYDNISIKRCDPGQTGLDGFAYKTTALANTVDGSGVVTEGTGAALTGIALANVPSATNLVTYSNTFENAAWQKINAGAASSPIVTDNYAVGPLGDLTASRIQLDLNGGTTTSDYTGIQFSSSSSAQRVGSIYARSLASDVVVIFRITATHTTHTIGSEWVRISDSQIGSANVQLLLRGTFGTADSADLLISGAQIEAGTIPTPYIPTSGSTASTDAAVLDFSGVTGFTTPNETRVVATGLNASLEADPTDTTERTIDVDDWDGTDLSDLVPHGNIISVTQYAPGERP